MADQAHVGEKRSAEEVREQELCLLYNYIDYYEIGLNALRPPDTYDVFLLLLSIRRQA